MAFIQRRIQWLLPTLVVIIITVTIWRTGYGHPVVRPAAPIEQPIIKPDEKPKEPPAPEPPKPVERPWEFNLERDELNLGLSNQQCQVRSVISRHTFVFIHMPSQLALCVLYMRCRIRICVRQS